MKPPIEATISSPLLDSLVALGAFNGNGLIDIKPFRDWKASPWKDKVFTMRLCNAGEVEDILKDVADVPENARPQALKQEILIRAIFQVDGRALVTQEELKEYNDKHNTDVSSLQYLRIWIRDLEDVVVNRLDAIYQALTIKQIRYLQDQEMCEKCSNLFDKNKNSGPKIKYCLGEILCSDCYNPEEDDEEYGLKIDETEKKKTTESSFEGSLE